MAWLLNTWNRIRGLFVPPNEALLDEELRFHVEMETEENLRQGMPPAKARSEALKRFGPVASSKENYRDRATVPFVGDLWRDLRYAARSLRRSPGFTAFAVLSLALGLGANIAIFSIVDVALLRTLPVRDPQNLRIFNEVFAGEVSPDFSHPEFRSYREAVASVADLFGVGGTETLEIQILRRAGEGDLPQSSELAEQEAAAIEMVSGNFFRGAGVSAVYGRLLGEDDDATPGAHPVAVVSHSFFQRRFALEGEAIGRAFRLNNTVFTIVGVAAPGFRGVTPGDNPDIWVPMMMQTAVYPGRNSLNSTNHSWIRLMMRVNPGVPEDQLRSVLRLQLERNAQEQAKRVQDPELRDRLLHRSMSLESGAQGFEEIRESLSEPLLILLVLAGLVLLVSCLNVASLLLARAAARQREIAVRLSLGAGRYRLMRLLLSESALLTSLALAASAGVAWAATEWLTRSIASSSRMVIHVEPSSTVVLFALGLALFVLLVFGLAPAWRSSGMSLADSMKEGARSATLSKENVWFRKSMVVLQVSASVVLLVGALLMSHSLYNLLKVNTGFDRENLIGMRIDPRNSGYALPRTQTVTPAERNAAEARLRQLYDDVLNRVGALASIRSVGYTDCGFLRGCRGHVCCMVIPGVELKTREERSIRWELASEDYFRTVGLPILVGRGFTSADRSRSNKVAVLNETGAKALFNGENPIGKVIEFENEPEDTVAIVGVVADAKYSDLREETPRMLFVPFFQGPSDTATLYVRSGLAAETAIPAIRKEIASIAPDLKVSRISTALADVERSVMRERLVSELCGWFTIVALLLVGVGLYGVMAFQVLRRTGEFGIRMALGAQRSQILWSVLAESLALGATGIAIGISISVLAARSLSSLLYGVSAWDPATVTASALIVAGVAFLAGFLPARRASGVDPANALRCE